MRLCVSLCDFAQVCVTLREFLRLCASLCDFARVCATLCEFVWLCTSLCDFVVNFEQLRIIVRTAPKDYILLQDGNPLHQQPGTHAASWGSTIIYHDVTTIGHDVTRISHDVTISHNVSTIDHDVTTISSEVTEIAHDVTTDITPYRITAVVTVFTSKFGLWKGRWYMFVVTHALCSTGTRPLWLTECLLTRPHCLWCRLCLPNTSRTIQRRIFIFHELVKYFTNFSGHCFIKSLILFWSKIDCKWLNSLVCNHLLICEILFLHFYIIQYIK